MADSAWRVKLSRPPFVTQLILGYVILSQYLFFDKSVLCISPISIPNPNKGKFVSAYTRKHFDCDSDFIRVPCGHCKDCVAIRQMYLVQRVRMEALNCFLYFSTLTYDNAHLPHISVSSGYDISFLDVNHLQNLFKRLRVNNSFGRPFRYLAVSERGSVKSRPHAHILWFLPMYPGETFSDGLSLNSKLYDSIKNYWSVNVGSDRCPIYEPFFTYHKKFYRGKLFTNYDTHFVVPNLTSSGYNSVAFYVSKYMFKYSDKESRLQSALRLNLPSDEYDSVWNLVKSRAFSSRSFGLGFSFNRSDIVSYLRKCVALSDRKLGYPQFFNPDSSQSFPLSPFYRHCNDVFPVSIAEEFFDCKELYSEFDKSWTDIKSSISDFERISNIVDKDTSINLNFLFD